jgi:SAM-dependent methyltransferase
VTGRLITAAVLRACTSPDGAFDLLRELGYPVTPVKVQAAEWRRCGIDVPWSDELSLHLAARTLRLDLYLVSGDELPAADEVTRFLRALTEWNVIVKPAVMALAGRRLAIYDLSARLGARRLDVDLDAPSPHALDRLNLLAAGENAPRIFDRALDRESLTRQFFERFRRAVRDTAAVLQVTQPRETADAVDAQALLILSRLLFLYFIQQKGWLGGERRFLVDRLESALRDGDIYYATVLRPLFFGCLNTAVADRDSSALALGKIPYLNGGLFEPSAFELRHPLLELPNELTARVIEEVFERFSFSIDESDAAGTHIDPEMLGKVFESLMAADERAASGSFYTPREIVDALTERAVVEWLGGGEESTRDALRALLRGETGRKVGDPKPLLRKLAAISVLDPACGSGALLLGALRVIERLTRALGGRPSRRRIIERSLFGVDRKPEAVRLCELRLWLAIVAQADKAIDPLPNLDRNILQGDSLLSPLDFLGDNRMDVYRDWVAALRAQRDLVERYRSAPQGERPALARMIRGNDLRIAGELVAKSIDLDESELQRLAAPQHDLFGRVRGGNLERCRELHERIAASRATIERLEEGELAFFAYDIHFAPVIARGGFDVVAGNPPWVRNSRIDERTKAMLRDRYRLFRAGSDGAAFHQPDLAIAFVERALSLAAPGGAVSLLVPAKLMNAAYAGALRRHVATRLLALDDWSSDAHRLFDADTFPLGLTASPRARDGCIEVTAAREHFRAPRGALTIGGGSEWVLLPPDVQAVVARITGVFAPLERVLGRVPVMGVKSGDNDVFFLDVARTNTKSVRTSDGICIPLRFVCRCLRGRDVRRWRFGESSWMLWPPAGGWRRAAPRWAQQLADARGVKVSELRLSYVRPEHAGIKVVWKDLSRGIAAVALPETLPCGDTSVPLVPNQTLYALDAASLEEAQVLSALLNSTIVNVLATSVAERAKDCHFRYFARTIARVPLPQLPRDGTAWRRLLRGARQEAQEDVDAVVASLYGVTPEEHQRLAAFLARQLGVPHA